MDLVICNTPLQVIQIESLIKKNILKEGFFDLVFFVYNETDKLTYYYNRLKKLSNRSTYLKYQKFPFYVYTIKKIIKHKTYNSIYTASIDNKLNHYILSFVKFDNLYTIDDGTANIWQNSNYYIKKRSIIKSSLHYMLGCRYNLERTKKIIKNHYTIYKDIPNIVENTIYNDIFLGRKKNTTSLNSINIFLGTVYNEITDKKENLIVELAKLFHKKNFYYIPHPRDDERYFSNVLYIEDEKISEEIIFNMLDNYSIINLYGFGSSTQFNLMNIEGINNYQLKSMNLKLSIDITNYTLEQINLDDN